MGEIATIGLGLFAVTLIISAVPRLGGYLDPRPGAPRLARVRDDPDGVALVRAVR